MQVSACLYGWIDKNLTYLKVQVEKLVVAAVGEGKRPTSYKEIFAAVIAAVDRVEEEQQRQAAVSSSAAACKAAGGGVTLLVEGCSTGERAQLDKQSTVQVSRNMDKKDALTDANSMKPVFVGTSPDTQSAGNSEAAVLAPLASQALPYLSKITAACHTD